MTTLNEYIKEQMSDNEFVEEWQRLEPEYAIIRAIIEARCQEGLTQDELAARCGLKQSAISRLETGGTSPTLKTLEQLAEGLGKRLEVRFV